MWDITVRPWEASGGSTVHDELVSVEAEEIREALFKFYEMKQYDFKIWRVVNIAQREK
jgi:hypothetical protein